MIKSICVVTSSRADYGQLKWLIDRIRNDSKLELQLIATGSHLSPTFGSTYQEIVQNGDEILRKIEINISSDSPVGISKTMGLALISFSEAIEELKPDIIIILGDRSEMLAVAAAALIAGVPVAHIHGGEITEGAYDDSIRHAITKLSTLHFTSTDQYRNRVIQLGEHPKSVFNVGALAVESANKINFMSKNELQKRLGLKLQSKSFLITYHPETKISSNLTKQHFIGLLSALNEYENTSLIFTYPNSDKNGNIIIRLMEDYIASSPEKATSVKSLGQVGYLSALRLVDVVIGNSSSGILEAPILNTATVNIGERQRGRIHGPTIFNCNPNKCDIGIAIDKALSFDNTVKWGHPYGRGDTSEQITNILRDTNLKNIGNRFFDISRDITT